VVNGIIVEGRNDAFGLVTGDEVGYFKAGTTTCGATTDAFVLEGAEIFCSDGTIVELRAGSGIESVLALGTGDALGLSGPVVPLDAFADKGAEIICNVGTMVNSVSGAADGAVVAASKGNWA
jgi:hypothetical protein